MPRPIANHVKDRDLDSIAEATKVADDFICHRGWSYDSPTTVDKGSSDGSTKRSNVGRRLHLLTTQVTVKLAVRENQATIPYQLHPTKMPICRMLQLHVRSSSILLFSTGKKEYSAFTTTSGAIRAKNALT